MQAATVSIVIPCYNSATWVADAIQSALSQTYSPLEVVVVDDGSTDSSSDVIKSFNGRVIFEYVQHGGASRARNIGFQIAKGEFIHFLDADDILFPFCVKQKVKAILDSKADVVYSGGFIYDCFPNEGHYESQIPPGNSQEDVVANIVRSTIVTSLLMCRRSSLEAIGGFADNLVKGQEHDLLFRLALNSFKFVYLKQPLSVNRTHINPHSITTTTSRDPSHLECVLAQFEEKLRGTELWSKRIRISLAYRYYGLAVQYMKINDRLNAIRSFRHAKKINSGYISLLPRSRRLTVPVLGGYLSEKLLNMLNYAMSGSIR
jgi:glycosyltransferase involved in cell wall biosynthesis